MEDRTGDKGKNVMDLVAELEHKVRERTEAMDHFRSMYYMALTVKSPQFWLGTVAGALSGALFTVLMRVIL